MNNILIIDDDPALCRTLEIQLQAEGCEVQSVQRAFDGVQAASSLPNVILLDLNLPDQTGLDILPDLQVVSPESSVVLMTGNPDNRAAVEAMRMGAFDYLRKPLDLDELLAMIERICATAPEKMPVEGDDEEQQVSSDDMIGAHPKIIEIHKQIGLLARSPVTTLIQGASGTGKELAARILHNAASPEKPFVAINCSAVVATLLESELFGHEKGAFTGADRAKEGKLEHAGDGTVFLDEIGDMALDLQGKLLRVLQEGEFTRVGGLQAIPIRARIVAATHRNLMELIDDGLFRRDLFYRLNVTVLNLPSLTDRASDIPLLASALLVKISKKLDQPLRKVSDEVMEKLITHPWPGNVRELENVLTRAVALSNGAEINMDDLQFMGQDNIGSEAMENIVTLADAEKVHIDKILRKNNWNITHSASQLAISPTTLRKKIHDYGLRPEML